LANALYPLVEESEPFEKILDSYKTNFEIQSLDMMRDKLGLKKVIETDKQLIQDLEDNLQLTETDMTIFFRNLSDFSTENASKGLNVVIDAFYIPDEISKDIKQKWNIWFKNYAERLKLEEEPFESRKKQMNQVNPKYVLRNYMAQLAIDNANKGDYNLIDELFKMLKKPYDEQPKHQKWFAKRPDWARHKVGCSMLSCSS